MRDGVIHCAINMEDLEIPNNDDHVLLPTVKSSATSSAHQKNANKAKKQHGKKSN